MSNREKNKVIITTNLDNATLKQKERFMTLLVQAHKMLFKSVVGRQLE